MSRTVQDELKLLEDTLLAIKCFDVEDMDFNSEAALIRHFEVVGGIAKALSRFGVTITKTDKVWKNAIKTRDKISHSYLTLDTPNLVKAIKDIDHLIGTLPAIKSQVLEIKKKSS